MDAREKSPELKTKAEEGNLVVSHDDADDDATRVLEIGESDLRMSKPSSVDGAHPEVIDGKYRLMNCIGIGGMGTIYQCQAEGIASNLAIKILRRELAEGAAGRKRFEQEARAAGALNHPNIVAVYDSGVAEGGLPYIVMDFVDGTNLCEILRRDGHLTHERFLSLFQQACDALEHAHARGVIHRDLKPSNFIVTECGGQEVVKIVDFGIAKVLSQDGSQGTQLTQTGDVFGTPLYMSPEQCQGFPLDQRADVYSLGCVMYEALTGRPPFAGANAVQIILQHVTNKPRRLSWKGLELPEQVQQAVLKCLEKDREKRFSGMQELKRALEGLRRSSSRRVKMTALKLSLATLLVSIMAVTASYFISHPLVPSDGANALSVALQGDPEASWRAYQEAGERADRNKQFTEAEEMWKTAVSVAEKAFKSDDLRLARSLHDLAQLYHINRSDAKQAEPMFRRVLEIRKSKLSPADRDMADIYGHLGFIYNDLGRYDEADKNLKKAIEISEKADQTLYLHYLDVLGRGLVDRDRYQEAEQVYKKVLVRHEERSGANALEVADALESLGYLYFKQDQYEKAMALFKRSLEIREFNKQNENSKEDDYAWVLARLGDCYKEKKAYKLAESMFGRSARAYGLLDDSERTGDALKDQADVSSIMGQHARAATLLREALEFRRQREAEAPFDLIATLLDLTSEATQSGQRETVESAINEVQLLRSKHPSEVKNAVTQGLDMLEKILTESRSRGWTHEASMIEELVASAK